MICLMDTQRGRVQHIYCRYPCFNILTYHSWCVTETRTSLDTKMISSLDTERTIHKGDIESVSLQCVACEYQPISVKELTFFLLANGYTGRKASLWQQQTLLVGVYQQRNVRSVRL